MVPAVVMQLEALPLTSNGKVDRRVLPAPSFSGDQDQRVEPSTDLERQLHAIWAEVLGHADFGISDNFFVIGGHSLAAARLAAAVQRGLGLNLTVATIFLLPTIAEQAGRLSRGEPRTTSHLVTLQPGGDRSPLYAVHGAEGKVGGFIGLARALPPHRPVLALQGDESFRTVGLTLETLAARYADQILASHPGGPIHLIGFSAGGWYAHAVAAALLQRGACIGMFAVLDTHASARIHRRIALRQMGRTLLVRLPHHLPQLIRPPAHQRRRHYVVERLQALHRHLNSHLGLRWPGPGQGITRPGGTPKPEAAATGEDPFLALHRSYRPSRLPLVVDLFVPASRLALLSELWSFYGQQGVRVHPLFDDHLDFIHPENMEALARALEDALAIVEHGH